MREIDNEEINNNQDDFDLIIQDCQIKTGISDLSYQHDYYLYGKFNYNNNYKKNFY